MDYSKALVLLDDVRTWTDQVQTLLRTVRSLSDQLLNICPVSQEDYHLQREPIERALATAKRELQAARAALAMANERYADAECKVYQSRTAVNRSIRNQAA